MIKNGAHDQSRVAQMLKWYRDRYTFAHLASDYANETRSIGHSTNLSCENVRRSGFVTGAGVHALGGELDARPG